MRYEKFITRQMLRAEPKTLFVFGDNMIERGLGGQAKEMRGEPNAVGIPTKLLPGMEETDFFRDQDFDRVKPKIDAALLKLAIQAGLRGEIVWPADGIGTGLAQLKSRAPLIWSYIESHRVAIERIYRNAMRDYAF